MIKVVSNQEQTKTGPLPIAFNSDGTPLDDYKLYGTAEGAGVETENLIIEYMDNASIRPDGAIKYNAGYDLALAEVENGKTYSARPQWSGGNVAYGFFMQKPQLDSISYDSSRVIHTGTASFSFTAPITGWVVMWSAISAEYKHKLTIIEGSTAPSSYIPYGYKLPMTMESGEESTTTPIYIGDSKLMAEEYVDYGEQKIYKRTDNLWNGNITAAWIGLDGTFNFDSNSSSIIIECNPESEYAIKKFSETNRFRVISYASSPSQAMQGTVLYSDDSANEAVVSTPANAKYLAVYIKSTYSSNEKVTIISGSTPPDHYIPYGVQPTDPPVALPELSTYQGENTLSCSEGLGDESQITYVGPVEETITKIMRAEDDGQGNVTEHVLYKEGS